MSVTRNKIKVVFNKSLFVASGETETGSVYDYLSLITSAVRLALPDARGVSVGNPAFVGENGDFGEFVMAFESIGGMLRDDFDPEQWRRDEEKRLLNLSEQANVSVEVTVYGDADPEADVWVQYENDMENALNKMYTTLYELSTKGSPA